MSPHGNTKSKYDFSDVCRNLRSYTIENLAKIERSELAGSHLLGVAARAINLFETLLKKTFGAHIVLADLTYEEAFKPKLGKPFQRLTLGEMVNCLRMFDAQLTRDSKSSANDSRNSRKRRKTVSKMLSGKLDAICRLRAELVAHFKSEETSPTEASQLLKLINEVLDDSIFAP